VAANGAGAPAICALECVGDEELGLFKEVSTAWPCSAPCATLRRRDDRAARGQTLPSGKPDEPGHVSGNRSERESDEVVRTGSIATKTSSGTRRDSVRALTLLL